jgi:hypothetical protein
MTTEDLRKQSYDAFLAQQLAEAEKDRRRERTEQGLSPAQQTTRSANKARIAKRPGKGHRRDWEKEEN